MKISPVGPPEAKGLDTLWRRAVKHAAETGWQAVGRALGRCAARRDGATPAPTPRPRGRVASRAHGLEKREKVHQLGAEWPSTVRTGREPQQERQKLADSTAAPAAAS